MEEDTSSSSFEDIDPSKFLELNSDTDSDIEELISFKKPPAHVV